MNDSFRKLSTSRSVACTWLVRMTANIHPGLTQFARGDGEQGLGDPTLVAEGTRRAMGARPGCTLDWGVPA